VGSYFQGRLSLYQIAFGNPTNFVEPYSPGMIPLPPDPQKVNPADIVNAALGKVGSKEYAKAVERSGYGPGTDKCNIFVYETLLSAGASVPMLNNGSFGLTQNPPLAKEWSDPGCRIRGWEIISPPSQPGDVLSNGIHVGIVSGTASTVSANSTEVVHNNWGFGKSPGPNVPSPGMILRRYVYCCSECPQKVPESATAPLPGPSASGQ
jgi:hypothetical protein